MSQTVTIETASIAELESALSTLVWFGHAVPIHLVSLERACLAEALVALITRIRHLSSVNSLVLFQATREIKLSVTQRTLIRLGFTVRFQMLFIMPSSVRFAARITPYFLGNRVMKSCVRVE